MPAGRTRKILAYLALTFGAVISPSLGARAQTVSPPLVDLPGHVLDQLPSAAPIASDRRVADQPMMLTVVLQYADRPGLDAYLAQLASQPVPSRRFLSPAAVAQRFGPRPEAYDAVVAYLQGFGFTVVEGSANRLTLTVTGTRAQTQRAFNFVIGDYQLGDRTFFANQTNPRVPAGIASSIAAVSGLTNLARPQPKLKIDAGGRQRARPADSSVSAAAGPVCQISLPAPDCTPMALAAAYNFAGVPGATGAGQRIGLFEFDTFRTADVADELTALGLPQSRLAQLSQVAVNGGIRSSTPSGQSEVLLDIATVMGAAPGASYIVYSGPANPNTLGGTSSISYQAMLNVMINDNVDVISITWGDCEHEHPRADIDSIDAVMAAAEASGIGIFDASGDDGSTCGGFPNDPGVPDDAAHQTTVGGTLLGVTVSGAYATEGWWQDANGAGAYGLSGAFASGPGLPRPSYQAGYTAATTRSVPDVAAAAATQDSILVCQSGCSQFVYGTSLAAPLWAAGAALLNQSIGHRTGNLNAALYQVGNTPAFHSPAHMIGPGADFAHVGLGSFDLGALRAALTGTAPGPTATATPQPTATAPPGTVPTGNGGKGFGLSSGSGGVTLSWQPGTNNGYVVVRVINGVTTPFLVAPGQTSFTDPTILSGTPCYVVVPLGAGSTPLGVSDPLCVFLNTHSGAAPQNVTLRLNQSTTASLIWAPPAGGGQDSYLLAALPGPQTVTLGGSATSGSLPASGPECFVLFATRSGTPLGNSDVLCGLPGHATV